MKILQVHNPYIHPGGEDRVVELEASMLQRSGHTVVSYQHSNRELRQQGILPTSLTLLRSSWNKAVYHELRQILRDHKPDVMHVHNFWFALSPSIFDAAHDEKIPTVMTLHNFRLLCANALFFRKGQICEQCLGRNMWPALFHACYRQSYGQTAILLRMLQQHRKKGTWSHRCHRYIVLTEFHQRKFTEGGLPPHRLVIKPNFMPWKPTTSTRGQGVLYAGRLSQEKGIALLVESWPPKMGHPLVIAGDGPLRNTVQARAKKNPSIRWVGFLTSEEMEQQFQSAAAVVIPSICYEGFPMTLVEAFAFGRAVIAPKQGPFPTFIREGETGLLFEPGNGTDMIKKLQWLLEHPHLCLQMGNNARKEYEEKYTETSNISSLIKIYTASYHNLRLKCSCDI